MLRADTFIDDAKTVEDAIAAAEQRTSAEITCAVATESGRYDRAEAILGIAVAALSLWGAHLATGVLGSAEGGWSAAGPSLPWQLASVLGGFFVGNLLASYVHGLRRLAVGPREMAEEVCRAAAYIFHDKRLASTRGRGGVLIYLSLFERRLVVLADEGALGALGQAGLVALRDLGLRELQAGARQGALIATVEAAAERLAEDMPPDAGGGGALADDLLLYHPRP